MQWTIKVTKVHENYGPSLTTFDMPCFAVQILMTIGDETSYLPVAFDETREMAWRWEPRLVPDLDAFT